MVIILLFVIPVVGDYLPFRRVLLMLKRRWGQWWLSLLIVIFKAGLRCRWWRVSPSPMKTCFFSVFIFQGRFLAGLPLDSFYLKVRRLNFRKFVRRLLVMLVPLLTVRLISSLMVTRPLTSRIGRVKLLTSFLLPVFVTLLIVGP